MYHSIEFKAEFKADLEIPHKRSLERIRIRRGTQALAQLKPYVVEADGGPVEVADLFFADGSAVRTVPFELFFFVDE
jgi:hypothetical protein